MTDVTKNTTEISKENNNVSTHKRRSYRDIPLLIFIVAFAIFVMLGCTLLTNKDELDNRLYEEAMQVRSNAESEEQDTMVDDAKALNNPEQARYNHAMNTKEPIDSETLSDGRLKVWFRDGTVDVFGDRSTKFYMQSISDEDEIGVLPLDEEQAVNNALQYAEAKESTSNKTYGNITGYDYDATTKSWTGTSVSYKDDAYDDSITVYLNYTFNLTSGTWYELCRSSDLCSYSLSPSGSRSSTRLTYTISTSAYTGKDSCDTVSATATITNPKLTLTVRNLSNVPAPGIKITAANADDYSEYKNVTFTGTSTHGVKKIYYRYYSSKTYYEPGAWHTFSGQYVSTSGSFNKNTYGQAYAYARTSVTKTGSSTTQTAYNLKIDYNDPTVNSIKFYSNSGYTSEITSSYNGTVYVQVSVTDTAGSTNGSYSCVTYCKITNTSNGNGEFYLEKNVAESSWVRGSTTFKFTISGNDRRYANGTWKVEITDAVSRTATRIFTDVYKHTDIEKPEVVSYSTSLLGNDVTDNGGKWTNAPLKVKVTIKDQVGDATSVNARVGSINKLKAVIKYAGTTTDVTDTMEFTDGSSTKKGIEGLFDKTTTVTNKIYYYQAALTFALPYDPDIVNDAGTSLTITDKAGNSTTITGATMMGGIRDVTTYSIDTIAPQVSIGQTKTGVGDVENTYNAANKNKDVVFTVNAKDDGSEEGEYYFESGGYNNGSGLKSIKIFTDTSKTDTIDFYCGDVYCPNGEYTIPYSSFDTINTNKPLSITIPYDSTTCPTFYVVAYDFCGNASDRNVVNSTSTYTYYGYTFTGKYPDTALGNYYLSQNMEKTVTQKSLKCLYYVNKDYYAPQIVVKDANKNVIASTNGYGNTTNEYVFQWSKNSQTFYIDYYYGCSGATGTCTGQTAVSMDPYSSGGTPIDLTNVMPPEGSIKGWSSVTAGEKGKSETKHTSYKVRSTNAITIANTLANNGRKTFTISISNKETHTAPALDADGKALSTSATIKIITQIDTKSPEVSLLGFYESETINSADFADNPLYKESDLTSSSNWINAVTSSGQGLWAIFELKDTGGSGIVGGQLDTEIDESGVNTGAKTKYYGINGLYDHYEKEEKNRTYAKQWASNYPSNYTNGLINGVDTTAGNSYVFKFQYGAYSYVEYGYATQLFGKYCVIVQMFSLDKFKENCSGFQTEKDINGESKEVWDIKTGTFLDYTFAARDFLGNSTTYKSKAVYDDTTLRSGLNTTTHVTSDGYSYVLRYYVDPFPVYANIEFFTVPKASYDVIKNLPNAQAAVDSGNGVSKFLRVDPNTQQTIWAVYDTGDTLNGSATWTKDYIIAEVTKVNSLSLTEVKWGEQDYATITDMDKELPHNNPTTMKKSGTVEWIVFFSEESRNVKFGLEVYNLAYRAKSTNNGSSRVSIETKSKKGDPYYMLIKQDITPPRLTKVFFSDKSNLTNYESAILAFDAEYSGGNYTYVLDVDNSSAYVSGQTDMFVWSTKEVYAYFIVTDTVGGLTGSGAGNGIDGTNGLSVKIDGVDQYCTPISKANVSVGETMYVLKSIKIDENTYVDKTWGCTSKAQLIGFNFTVIDAMGNTTSGKYEGNGKLTETGANVFRLFPVVDSVNVISEFVSTNPAYTKTVSSSIGMVNALKGTATQYSTIILSIKYTTGISGVKYYLKETDYGTPFNDSLLYAYNRGEVLPSDYNFKANGWGHYVSGKFMEGEIAAERVVSVNETASSLVDNTVNISITMTSLKKRLYLLAVSGTGTYYVLDLGDIFIDIEPVQFDPNMTIFAVESSASSTEEETYGEMAYANMQTIWTNVVGNTYTNGKVYIYYQLSDGASGIDDNTVLYNNNTKLEKILVTGIPVWHVDGEPTNIRVFDINEQKPEANISGDYVTLDDVPTNLLSSKVSSNRVTIGYIDEVYYRLLVTETGDYTIDAKDIAGNVWKANSTDVKECGAKNTIYSIRIDSATVTLQSTTYYGSTRNEYKGSLVDYTNDDVIMEWRVDYGSSGFGHIEYTVTDNFQGIIDQYSAINGINIPKISVSQSNTYVLEYLDANNKAQKYDTNISANDVTEVEVKANAGYWEVEEQKTPVSVASNQYSKFGTATYTIDYKGGKTTLKDVATGGPARIIYDYLDIPDVHFDANGNILLTYLDYNGDVVQIDTGAPKKANNVTKISTKLSSDGIYYWMVNETTTSARVAADPIYPKSIYNVEWEVIGSGSDALIAVTDKYTDVSATLRIPTIKYDASNKVEVYYYADNGFITKPTSIVKPANSTLTITVKKDGGSNVNYWYVENERIGKVNTAYYGNYLSDKTWTINTASNYLYCTFVITAEDTSVTYRVRAFNNVSEEYAVSAEEKEIEISFVEDTKEVVDEYENDEYSATWNIKYGSSKLGYVDYEVIDDKGNLFTYKNISMPIVTISDNNTIVITYDDPNEYVQSYDTGLYAVGNTVTLAINSVGSSSAQCVVSAENNSQRASITVDYDKYGAALSPTWIYNFKTNLVTLKDTGATGLARNTFTSVFGTSVRITTESNNVSLTMGSMVQSTDIKISANSDGFVELTTVKEGEKYYWYLNDYNTGLLVSNDYPSNFYDVEWKWNANNSSDYSIVDNIDHASVRMRVPVLSNNNNKIDITYIDEYGKLFTKPTLVTWSNAITLRGTVEGSERKWEISNAMGEKDYVTMSQFYNAMLADTTWEYDFANSSVKLTFTVNKNNAHVNYIIKAANNSQVRDFNRPVSEYAESIVSIDVTAPIIDDTVGNIAELSPTEDIWHALAKSLRVSIYDSMSGMGASTQACDVINGEAIYYENAYIEIGYNKLWLVKCDDGLYRAYNGISENINGVPVVRMTDLYYLDQHATYKLVVFDKAGNISEYSITPKVDVVAASVTNLIAYDSEENKYEQGTPATKWLQDTGISTINWTDDYVYVTMDVTYGPSGYTLYVSENYKKNVSGGLDATWMELDINLGHYELVGDTRYNASTGLYTDTIKYYIGKGTEYLYNYYMFRALSKAQNTELNVYKSYTNSSKPRATETGNSAPNSTDYKLRIELESYEAADQGMQYAEISIGKRSITELIAIDKTTPTVVVSAKDVSNANYGNRYNGNNLVWEIPEGNWVNKSVTMTVTLGSESGYISGNALYYRSYSKDLSGTYKWSEWTMVLPTGRIYVLQDGKWTQQSGSTTGITVEGKIRYYNKDGINDETVTISNYANVLKYNINSSTNNVVYEYYTETGAGKKSAYGMIGRIDDKGTDDINDDDIYGIKIDTNTPNVSASGKATYEKYGSANAIDIQEQLKTSFNNASNVPYVVTASASWTYYNSVVIGLAISNVGYSGITVTIGDEVFDVITYEQYLAESKALGSSSVYRYYYVGDNGETKKDVEVFTFAGTDGNGVTIHARIDNTTPIVYVSSINGTHATNWGWDANKNLYSNSIEYWYISETIINLGVGIVEDDAFTTTLPYSGYEIEYQVNNAGEWLPVAGDALIFSGIGDNVINGDIYRFRITSGAGLYYYIGEDIINNHIEKNNNINFHKQEVVNTIKAVTGNEPIQSHVVEGEVGKEKIEYKAEKSEYQMFVDANRYSYTYNGKVYLGKDYGYDINTNNFMSYSVRESDANGIFDDTIDTQFHRGDVIELTYNAKYNVITDDSYSGNGYNYFHDYTVGSPDGTERIYCEDDEKSGSFKVQFVNDNVNLTGYFIAEVRVNYGGNNVDGQDVFYKQTAEGKMVTTGEANYVYSDGTTVKSISVALDYQYFRYNENTTLSRNNSVEVKEPTEVGAYYVYTTTKVDGDKYGNFRITNENSVNGATDYKDFVIKYFAKPVHVTEYKEDGSLKETIREEIDSYYLINNVTDFYYVDNNYYNVDANGNVITTPNTYLNSDFILNTNLEITKRLEGTFAGTFNANGSDNYGYTETTTVDTNKNETTVTRKGYNEGIHTITILVDGVSNGKHSVFEKVSGIVKNLEVVLSDVMVVSVDESATTNVGILASVIDGAIYNVSVRGDIVLDGINTTSGKVNVGGLAGTLGANAELGVNSDLVYVDVRINNNGNVVNNANVSTLAGYVNSGAKFNNVQIFGEVTVYGVNSSVNIGTVYGDADAGYYNGSTMNYLANNAFLNDYTVSGASSSSAAVNVNGMIAVDYAAMVDNDTTVAGKAINDMIIDRLYSDFGYSYNGQDTAYGIGTADSPLIISTVEQLMAIDNYMNLSFVVSKTVKTLDMSEYDATVAIHKVFNGTFDTEDKEFVVLNNFAGNVDTFDGNYFGLFGQLNGQVNNVVFGDIAVDFTYEGSNALYAGLVAGKIYQDAVINNIVLIGTQKITSTNGAVYAGGIVGSANGGRIYDVFSMNNISVNGTQVVAGGIVGTANDLYLYNEATDGAIYLLGRVEGNASSLVVGSAIGSGTLEDYAKNVYAIKNNTYNNGAVLESKPIGSTSDDYGINMVEFTDEGMRSSSFASGKNAFNLVFSQYYPLQGNGTANSPFIVEDAEDFGYVNIALYANYSITKSITFTEFTTIGEGLVFSGSINGSGGDNISAEESSIASLSGLDAPLVYNSTGSITNISLNIIYENTVKSGETFYFGAVAVYNSGTIKNVTVAGSVDITSEANDTTLYVSGFVGVNYGGDILLEGSDEQISKIQNSISALDITINGGGTAYVGGYAGVIEQGQPKFSYGLATGTITVTDVQTVYAGLFAGASYGECEWVLGEAASIDYTYTITVDGVTIPKTDENGDPIVDNFYGVEFIK